MYNEIMDAVTKQLSALFPPEAGYTVYTDAVEQGLSEPCFFVQFLEPSEKPMIGTLYYRKNAMCIQFLPGDIVKPSRELNRVLDILMEQMLRIELKSGRKINGSDRSGRIDGGVLLFLVQYNTFEARETQAGKESMTGIQINEMR